MRRWAVMAGAAAVLLTAGALVAVRSGWFRTRAAVPLPVRGGDLEVAFLHVPTGGDTWENFVWGVKRAEMLPGGLRVDDRKAFPDRTTDVPQLTLTRDGFDGAVHVRWYKVTNDAPVSAWVSALAARNPPPAAVIGGWTSDRARELADALSTTNWNGPKPLLLLPTATADAVYPEREDESFAPDYRPPELITLYDRSFRFCFTNKQMAAAVTEFVFHDGTLRPGPAVWPGLRAAPAGAAGPLPALLNLGELAGEPPRVQAFAVGWKDDPYSLDLLEQFREAIPKHGGTMGRPPAVGSRPGPAGLGAVRPRIGVDLESNWVPFSTGRFGRPNPYEARIVDDILGHPHFPRRGERTILVLPAVTAPARRVLAALTQGNPGAARRLVAVTGDGIPVNALFRDGEFAWPVRALPIPLVLFTHADPFAWDEPGGPKPPPDYELTPPKGPRAVKNTTEDIQMFTRLTAVLARAAFADGTDRAADSADDLERRFRGFTDVFEPSGDRATGVGEHVVVLRPTPRVEGTVNTTDATLEVWVRGSGRPWVRRHARPVVQTARPNDGGSE